VCVESFIIILLLFKPYPKKCDTCVCVCVCVCMYYVVTSYTSFLVCMYIKLQNKCVTEMEKETVSHSHKK
jgi:hypothetical protein